MTRFECQIVDVTPLKGDVFRVQLQVLTDTPCPYQAGQYLQLLLPSGEQPAFSLASTPAAWPALELHVRRTTDNGLSAKVVEVLQQGGKIAVSLAAGDAVWQAPAAEAPILMLAASTGFAQVKSLVEQALAEGWQGPLYVYWGVRVAEDLYWPELAQQWVSTHANVHFIPVVSEGAGEAWQGRTGLLHEAVLADKHDLTQAQVWVSGSPGMVYATLDAFMLQGLHKQQMHSDVFAYAPRDEVPA
ncbi:NAD(P)H-flavin reductase [Balneatrix alpica]|uniref:NAD(P)H-flavin reductase n=1 Tax=Balneatrix alpica TaxID=75684 RepID=A0ABV5ZB00_9GAMM|nr:NAD(P)H-flavin reductase [Balneatrix alpica]